MKNLLSQLTYSQVVSTLALFVALGGGAYAINLGRNDVTSRNIKNNTIRSADVKRNGISGSDISGRTLKTEEFTAAAGQSSFPSCDPEGVFIPCAQTSMTTPVDGRILVIAAGEVAAGQGGSATCDALLDDTQIGRSAAIGAGGEEAFTVVGVSGRAPAGRHTATLQCVQDTAGVQVQPYGLTAVLVGGR